MNCFEKYKNLNIDGSLINLEQSEITVPYFCYPVNAEAIGFEGSVLYCFLPEYRDMVFAANPESCADTYVYPLAKNFKDFIRLILACGCANIIEQIVWMNKEQFEQHMNEEKNTRTDKQSSLIKMLAEELNLAPMENPFEYVKNIQAYFDGNRIKYSNEYYDVLGIEI